MCPNPTAPVCRNCGLLNPPTDHPCAPQCQICGEGHLTGAKECRQRLKTIRQHPPPHQTKASATYSERGRKPQRRPRWFSSERDASRSGSRPGSRSRSRSFPPLPPADLNHDQTQGSPRNYQDTEQQQQEQQQPESAKGTKMKNPNARPAGDGTKVSWLAEGSAPAAPHSLNQRHAHLFDSLARENQALKRELQTLRATHARELAELRALITGIRTSHPAPTSTNSPAPVAPQSSSDPPVTLSTLQSMMSDLTQQITHQLTQQLNETLLHQTTQLSARLDTIENRIDARISEQSSIAR